MTANNSSRSILLVEDNPRDVELFEEYLDPHPSSGYSLTQASSLSAATQHLAAESFDLIILDLDLEDSSGIGTFETLHGDFPGTPIVILTGREDEELASEVLNRGAQDYLLKNELTSHWLSKAIDYAIESHRSQQRYRTIFHQVTEPIFICDLEDRFLDCNEAAGELLGYERDELLDLSVPDIVTEEDRTDTEGSMIRERLETHGKELYESVNLRKDGSTVPVEVRLAPIEYRGEDAVLGVVRDISARKAAQREREQSARRLQIACSAAELGIWEWNLQEDTVHRDERLQQMMGLSTGEFSEFKKVLHPDDRDRILKTIRNSVKTGDHYHDEFVIIHGTTGEKRWIESRGEVQFDDQGNPKRMVGANRDVTDRKEAEENLRQTAQRLNQATSVAELGIWEWNLDDDTVHRDEAFERMFGISSGPQRQFRELLHPDDRESILHSLDECIQTGEPFHEEYRIVHGQSEEVRWIESRGSVQAGSDDEPAQMVGAVRDITEFKRTELDLRDANQRFKLASEMAMLGYWSINLPDMTLNWSDQIARIFGLDPSDPVPDLETVFDLYVDEDRPIARTAVNRAIDQGEAVDFQLRIRRPDGELRHVQAYGEPRYDETGEMTDLFGVFQDITKPKQYELDLEERYKEQACLRSILELDELDLGEAPELIREVVERIPPGFRDPEQTHACVTFQGEMFTSPGFVETNFHQRADFSVDGEQAGQVDVYVDVNAGFQQSDDPFLPEERDLIDAVAQELSSKLERLRAELALRESEQRFRQMAETIDDVFWMSDPATNETLYVNPAFEEIWGRSSEQVLNDPDMLLETVHPDDRDQLENRTRDQIEGTYNEEYRIIRPDGETRWIRDRAFPVQNEVGEVERIVGLAQDITEQKRAQRELRIKERAMAAVEDGIVITKAGDDQPIEYVNEGFLNLTGYERQEVLGRNCRFLQGPDTDPEVVQQIRMAIDTEQPLTVDILNYRNDGTSFWNQLSLTPVFDRDGQLTHFVGIQKDITERKQREEDLQTIQNRMELTLDQTDSVMFELDPRTGAISRRGWFSNLDDFDEEELADLSSFIERMVHPVDRDAFRRFYEQFLNGEREMGELDYRSNPERGPVVWIHSDVFTQSSDGEDERIIGLSTDVTELKHRELILENLHETTVNLNQQPDKESVCRVCVEAIQQVLGYSSSGIWLLNEAGTRLEPEDEAGAPEDLKLPVYEPGDSLSWQHFEAGEAQVYSDLREVEGTYDQDPVIRSEIIVPVGDYGVLNIGSFEVDAFDETDLAYVKLIARHVEQSFNLLERERSLREARDRMELALDVTTAAVWEWDPETDLVTTHPTIHPVLQTRIESTEDFLQELHPEDRDSVRKELMSAVEERSIFHVEYRVRRDGSVRWLEDYAKVHTDEEERPLMVGVNREITDQKEAERALQESELRFRQLAETINEVHWMTDPAYEELRYMNPAGEELFGLDLDEMYEDIDSIIELIPEDDRTELESELQTAAAGTETDEYEFRVHRPDGTRRWVRGQAHPVLEDDGTVKHVVGVSRDITDQKEAEQALQESELRFRQLAENIEEVFWMTDPEKEEILYLSPAFEDVWERPVSSLMDDPSTWLEAVHPEDRERVRTLFPAQAEENYDIEYRIRTEAGEIKWIHDKAFPVQNDEGEVYRIVGVAEDITERKRFQEELEQQRQRLKLALEAGKIGVWESNPQTGEEVWDDRLKTILQHSGETFDDFINLVHPDDRDLVRERTKRGSQTGSYEDEFRIVRPDDGETRWLRALATIVDDENGTPQKIIGVNQDITNQKERQRSLEAHQQRLKLALEAGEIGVWVWNLKTGEEIWDDRMEEIFQFTADDYEDFFQVVHPEDRDHLRQAEERGQEEGEYDVEYRIMRTDGEVRWLRALGTIVEEDGEEKKIIGTTQDITEQKLRERELESQKEALQESLEEKNTLLQEVHHRVRNNLQSIISLLSLTARKATEPSAVEVLRQSINRIRSMSLVHRLLHESDNLASVSPTEYLRELVNTLNRKVNPETPIKINFDISSTIELDPDRLTTVGLVVNELVSNSIEHAFPDEPGTISITFRPEEDSVELIVRDNGRGFDETRLGDDDQTLGLTLVENLVENQLNGTRNINSNDGTRVTVTFPSQS